MATASKWQAYAERLEAELKRRRDWEQAAAMWLAEYADNAAALAEKTPDPTSAVGDLLGTRALKLRALVNRLTEIGWDFPPSAPLPLPSPF